MSIELSCVIDYDAYESQISGILPISTDAEDQWRGYKLKLHRCAQNDDISKLPCLIPFIKFPNSSDSGRRSVIVVYFQIYNMPRGKYFYISSSV